MNSDVKTSPSKKQTVAKGVKPHQKRTQGERKPRSKGATRDATKSSAFAYGGGKGAMDDLKREISLSFLKEGNVTSYLEFIKIAYYEYFKEMDVQQQDESTDIAQNRAKYSADGKFLKLLKALLSEVEQQTASNAELAIEKLVTVANLFKDKHDLRQALFYGRKAFDLANWLDNHELVILTQTQIGDIQQELGELEESRWCFEESHKLAIAMKNEEQQTSVSVKLCNIFKDMAQVNGRVTSQSIQQLDKAYDFCTNLNDYKLEGDVCYSLGIAQQDLNEHSQAVVQLNKCKALVEQQSLLQIAGKVQAALAFSLQTLGQDVNAEDNLLKLFKVSVDEQENKALAAATLNLGVMYYKQGKKAEAMDNLRKHYDYSKKIDEVEVVDKARINYGITLGEWSVDTYIDAVNTKDLWSIVDDKIKDVRDVDI